MTLPEQIDLIPSERVGAYLASAGAGGSALQAITEWTNLFVMFGNAALVMCGLYLMYHKVRQMHSKRKGYTRRGEDA